MVINQERNWVSQMQEVMNLTCWAIFIHLQYGDKTPVTAECLIIHHQFAGGKEVSGNMFKISHSLPRKIVNKSRDTNKMCPSKWP